jgi:hypothetical protein
MSDYPYGKIAVANSSGNVANASGVATLPAASGKTTYLAGFSVRGAGATAASIVQVTVTGLAAGTMTFDLPVVAGATLSNQPLDIYFAFPLPASAPNTAIVVTCPALGSGNTNNSVNAWGYQQ